MRIRTYENADEKEHTKIEGLLITAFQLFATQNVPQIQ